MIIPSYKAGYIKVPQLLSTTDITSTGTQNYTVPAGTQYLEIEMVGGGGGGGHTTTLTGGRLTTPIYCGGGGGGGGAYVKYTYRGSLHGGLQTNDIITFTVGAGGSGGVYNGAVRIWGGTGGSTTLVSHARSGNTLSFSPVPTAGGGGGGETETVYGNAVVVGGTGGIGSNGDVNTNGNPGLSAESGTNVYTGFNGGTGGVNGGSSVFGNTTAARGGYTGSTGSNGTVHGLSGSVPGNGAGGGALNPATWGQNYYGIGQTGGSGQVRIKAYG